MAEPVAVTPYPKKLLHFHAIRDIWLGAQEGVGRCLGGFASFLCCLQLFVQSDPAARIFRRPLVLLQHQHRLGLSLDGLDMNVLIDEHMTVIWARQEGVRSLAG
jgi:hypothetical protein